MNLRGKSRWNTHHLSIKKEYRNALVDCTVPYKYVKYYVLMQTQQIQAGEMTHLAKCLFPRYEDLSSHSQNPQDELDVTAYDYPSTGSWNREDPWVFLASQAESESYRFSESQDLKVKVESDRGGILSVEL